MTDSERDRLREKQSTGSGGGPWIGYAQALLNRLKSNEVASSASPSLPAQSLLQALADPALTLDKDGCILEENQAAADVFGLLVPGQKLSLAISQPEIHAAVKEALALSERRTFQLDMRTPLERQFLGTVVPLLGDGPALLVSLRDLTEQDRLAAMRADFVANASHELRTPLASLKGFIETLQGPARDDIGAQQRFLAIMAQQADRMTRLIDDLLSLSRIEMRAHIPPQQTVDLNEIANEVGAALTPLAERATAKVSVRVLGRPARVRGDKDEVTQAIQNLVQNAIKYGRLGGHVDVCICEGNSRRLRVVVQDDGPGIAPEHLPRLTERFYRVNTAASRAQGGTGLGLAIVKHIMVRHRGTLLVASTPGKGAMFTLEFPPL